MADTPDTSTSLPATPQPGLWRFGRVALDERLAALQVDGVAVALDRSGYDVLLALLRHAGEVVTKDELLDAGWPGRVVSENSLAKAISRLRQTLGEDGEAIRVVHGYGYRLAAAVGFQPSAAESAAAAHDAMRLREGDPLPHRPGWRLVQRLGQGSAGIAFLARSGDGEERAVKLATGEAGLRSLKREIALTRYIRAVKTELPDVAQVQDWNLSQPPFFLERPYFADGHLADWAAARGGLASLPLSERIALCAQLCETVAGLHEIGLIHKDLKPENLYPCTGAEGRLRVVLADLGAGEALPSPRLAELGITMTLAADQLSQRAGSLLYLAPEVIAGEVPTQRSDVFALGVLLYQLAVGDLRRSLAPGWEADIDDELLREDIALAAAANPLRRDVDARALAQRLRALDARHAQRAHERREHALAERREQDLQRERSRRRLWLATATVAGLGLVGTLGMYAYAEHARRLAVEEAARADKEAGKSRTLVAFLTEGVLRQADPFAAGQGGEISLRQAIDNAAKDVDTRFRDNPDMAAAIHGTLGTVYTGLNDWKAAVAQHRAQLSRLRAAQPGDAAEIARASAALCVAQVWQGDPALRRKVCEQARDDHVAAGLEPDLPEVFLAQVDDREGRPRDGLARLEPRLPRILASNDDYLRNYALTFAATLYGRLGRIADAERAYAARARLHSRKPGGSMDLAWALTDHGRTLLTLGRSEEGKAELQRARRLFDRIAGTGHPQGHAPDIYLANYELARGHWQEARALAEPTYRALLAKVDWEHWTIFAALTAMNAAAELGDRDGAHRLMAEFDAMADQGLDRDFPYLREPHWSGYAATHLALGEYAAAQRYLLKLKALAAEPDPSPFLLARVECLEGRLQQERGETAAARANAHACRQRILAATSPDSPLLSAPDRLLAMLGATAQAAAPVRHDPLPGR